MGSLPPRPDPKPRVITLRWSGWHRPHPHDSRPVWIVTDEGALFDFVNVVDKDGLGRFGQIFTVEFRRVKIPRRWWPLRARETTRRRVKVVFGVSQ